MRCVKGEGMRWCEGKGDEVCEGRGEEVCEGKGDEVVIPKCGGKMCSGARGVCAGEEDQYLHTSYSRRLALTGQWPTVAVQKR